LERLVKTTTEATGALYEAGTVTMFPGGSVGITGPGGAGWDQNWA
jgi:hypothetical protein